MVAAMEELIACRKFVVEASSERVWSLLGGVVVGSLPGLERMHAIDESSFTALLRLKAGFIRLSMHLKGQVTADAAHPESLAFLIEAKRWGGLVQLNQKVKFTISSIDTDKTEVVCESMAQGMRLLTRLFLLGRIRSMARITLCGIEKRLQEIA